MAKERDAILFANASGNTGMPQNADERVANLVRRMDMMDDGGIAPEDRFLDLLVFPVGAGPGFGGRYLDAVRALRGQVEAVRQGVCDVMKNLVVGGGYIFSLSHCILADMPIRNICTMLEAQRDFGVYGKYPLS